MFTKLKQFNDLRKQANTLKSKLAEEQVTVENNGISITIDGNQEIKKLTIDSQWLQSDKKSALEQELVETTNKGLKKVQRLMAEKVREMGGLNIPGMN